MFVLKDGHITYVDNVDIFLKKSGYAVTKSEVLVLQGFRP